MIDPITCPHCGQRKKRCEDGLFRTARTSPVCSRPEWAARFGRQASAAGEQFDRLMNWVVGVLLVVFIAALLIVQVYPPR